MVTKAFKDFIPKWLRVFTDGTRKAFERTMGSLMKDLTTISPFYGKTAADRLKYMYKPHLKGKEDMKLKGRIKKQQDEVKASYTAMNNLTAAVGALIQRPIIIQFPDGTKQTIIDSTIKAIGTRLPAAVSTGTVAT